MPNKKPTEQKRKSQKKRNDLQPSEPVRNRRLHGPSEITINILLDGASKLAPADQAITDQLFLTLAFIQIFFKGRQQDAALFLFSLWKDSFRSGSVWEEPRHRDLEADLIPRSLETELNNPNLEADLKQFWRDVTTAIKPKKQRGRKPTHRVTELKRLKEQEHKTIREGLQLLIPGWGDLSKDFQDVLVNSYTNAVGTRTRRGRKKA